MTHTIDRALADPRLLGAALGDTASWALWLVVLRAAFGLLLDERQRQVFAEVAAGRQPPSRRVRELWAIVGRRAGKSRMAAAIAVYLAAFVLHKLAAGEVGTVLVLAASTDQARVVFSYAKAFFEASPVLRREIVDVTRSEIRLRNGVVIAIHANSFRTTRGRTLCGAIFDECAVWRDELSAQPDIEVYRSILPALLTTRGMLVGISTGYRRSGLLFEKHRDHFGQGSADTLVVQGSTQQFNGTIDTAEIAAQVAADPVAARSEWYGLFRDDISTFLDDELIDAAVEHGRPLELPPIGGVYYQAFADANGGTGGDSYTVSIGHKDKLGRVIIDVLRGTSGGKFDPHTVTWEYSKLLKEYGIRSVVGDSYAAEWTASTWQANGIAYTRSEQTKSEIYIEAIPLFTRGLLRLPDHSKLLRELRLLERHTHRSGRDTVDHPKNGRDDYANAACGVAVLVGVDAAAWMRNLKPVLERLRAMPRNPRYAQRGEGRYRQHRSWTRLRAL
jgi:hypothetical protein